MQRDTPATATARRPDATRAIRWWPAWLILGLVAAAVVVIRLRQDLPFQARNLATMVSVALGLIFLWLWWLLLSRAAWRWRWLVCGATAGAVLAGTGLFRIRGVSGDLIPILESRWASPAQSAATPKAASLPKATGAGLVSTARPDFPQFLGPDRNCVLAGPELNPDWAQHPPQVLWRRPVGAAWSGFAIVGNRAITQEQDDANELVTCYDLASGARLWQHADAAHYQTTLAGEGSRCTPTVVGNRVFALGATGILNCLDLAEGRRFWSRQITADAGVGVPEYGFAGSPLYLDGKIVVSAGGGEGKSLFAYRADTGEVAWSGGSRPLSYSSPVLALLAGVPQLLMFNARQITAHAPDTGAVLWEYPWGVGHPHVAVPVPVGSNRVVFSSGYGVGVELLEINRGADGHFAAARVWKSPRLKAKFANFLAREGLLYGLDDGVFACVDLKDGSQRWREGRYGHGQFLQVGDFCVVMAENGEIILLRPTPKAPNELHRFKVFAAKTWNPPALAGDLLLVRNDQEATLLRLPLASTTSSH